ncbi:MAG: NAD(P)H-binding protein, partial [SAR86 cluster bacterium]|nr:NAD(P)H-binding protein [SAR86 cluster bacterium]
MKLAITGANGHLGRRLIKTLKDQHEIIAIVRSSAARQRLAQEVGGLVTVVECDYGNAASLAAVLADVDYVVHLPGIIKESRANTFQMAHEDAAAALLLATAGTKVQGILYLSILGAHIDSTNACLASKARAEKLLLAGVVPARMIKVPMVLGEGDFASRALAKKARRSLNLDFHAASLEQPIYAGDVIAAIISSVNGEPSRDVVELAGPESLTRRALIKRAGWVLGRQPRVISLPLWPGLMVAGLLELLLSAPPVTRAMLGVLDHDDAVDTA